VRGLPFPDRFQVRLKLAAVIEITDPDSFTDTVVSGNSVFDPLASIGSTQPPLFDQLAAVYRDYVVISSTARIAPMSPTNAAGDRQFRCAIAPRHETTAFSTISDMVSQAYSVHKLYSIPGPLGKLAMAVATSKFLGLRDVYQASSSTAVFCTSVVGSNPSNEWYWHIGCQTPTVGTDIKVQLDFEVEYETEFFTREGVGISLLDRLLEQKRARDEYLKLKAKTPRKDGRVPRPPALDPLRSYVDSLESKESKETERWVLAKTPTRK
jgi:hypothetical protein